MPIEEFRQTLMQSEPNVALKDAPLNWFGSITHSDGGGVESIQIGGVTFSGTKIRQLFQLRSTWFEISLSDDAVTFKTRGYGHRVGMSQYGAQAMALEGAAGRSSRPARKWLSMLLAKGLPPFPLSLEAACQDSFPHCTALFPVYFIIGFPFVNIFSVPSAGKV